jgi:aryl-alcohol dehydrogenase-like predicted oxidoreductase
LGQTGIEVSCLGLGTVKIGRNEGVKYPRGFALPDDRTVQRLFEKAQELGINLIDTAPAYGISEQRLGKFLGNNRQWIICSKVGEEFSKGKSSFDFSGPYVERSVERSLRNLQREVIDIVLVHSDGNDEKIINSTDCLKTLARLKQRGLIRAYGVSTKTVNGGLLAVEHTDLVMVTFNPSATENAAVIRKAREMNKGVLVKKALMSGHLPEGVEDAVLTNLKFVFAEPGLSSVVLGTINPEHLEKNVAAVKQVFAESAQPV